MPAQKPVSSTTQLLARAHCPEVLLGIMSVEESSSVTLDAEARPAARELGPFGDYLGRIERAESKAALSAVVDDMLARQEGLLGLTSQLEAAEQRLADLDRQKARLEEDRGDAGRVTTDATEALARLEREIATNKAALEEDEARRPDGGETASHTTPFAWCTPFLKDFLQPTNGVNVKVVGGFV